MKIEKKNWRDERGYENGYMEFYGLKEEDKAHRDEVVRALLEVFPWLPLQKPRREIDPEEILRRINRKY
ncbi:hypothetical protein FUAX_33220 [Fulvitalea axinellae]|uniref:Uncharacterized protein n=1 Tax=Fulvitalea axinellae TaxID=1182444 RepID=A0AAU9DEH7_9BACT|nr:hypothetical protein FUAX_33220 [Fulvitalea axinellae]